MRYGVSIPARDPDPIDPASIARVARRAEELGFADLWVAENTLDHVHSLDPIVALTYAAAATQRVGLGVSVAILPVHRVPHLAHQWASLSIVSGGRAVLGVGVGRDQHYAEFGVPPEHRVTRFVDAVREVRGLWRSQGWPAVPIWFGGMVPAALRRAARHADGWMASGQSGHAAFAERARLLRQELEDAGRDPATYPLSKRVFVAVDDDPAVAQEMLRRWFGEVYRNADLAATSGIGGTVEQVRERVAELVDAGAHHVLLNTVGRYDEQLEAVAEVAGLR